MKKIYIGFSSPTGTFEPFADLIKWVEARPYDHVYILFPEPVAQENMIFQASKEMVNIFNKDIWLEANKPIKHYEIDITDDLYNLLWNFIKKNLGIPYSLLEDFGILLMKIFHLTNQPFNQGMSAEFCSKLGASICNLLGIEIPQDVSTVDPSLLDSILETKGLPCIQAPVF